MQKMQPESNPQLFNWKKVVGCLQSSNKFYEEKSDFPPEELCIFLQEFCKIFKQMSSLLGIAFDDVNEKVGIIRERSKEYEGQFVGLLSLILLEKERGVVEMNGENNKKVNAAKLAEDKVGKEQSI